MKMMRYCVVLILSLGATQAFAQNLLTNGTFDTTDDGWKWADERAVWRGDMGNTLTGGSGPGSVEVFAEGDSCNGATRLIVQTVPVLAGTLVVARVAAYVPGGDNIAEGAGAFVFWQDAFGDTLYTTQLTPSFTERDTWVELEASVTVPEGVSQAEFGFGVQMPGGGCATRAVAIFDDAWLAEQAKDLYVPATAAGPGSNGTHWSTTLWASNPNSVDVRLEGAFLTPGHDNSAAVSAPSTLGIIPAGGTMELTDVVTALGASGSGGLYLRPMDHATGNRAMEGINVVTYTFTPNPSGGGNFGQGIPAEEEGTAALLAAPGVRQDTAYRTNVGVINTSGETITVEVRILDSDGSTVGSASWDLPPYAQRQVSVGSLGVSSLAVGSAEFQRAAGSGGFHAYLSRVDNTSGDAIYVTAR